MCWGIIPEVLETRYGKCNENQRGIAERIVTFIFKNRPDVWKELVPIYDPEGKYRI